ncbi:MAG: 4-methyl-5(B-hydroxyethyl)-thiazole monophosphate biosynthesis protein [Gammaproteobacteria bacterium SG8_11]|nr:MAG: 4-methyl-5(B-hydroxyethyl)-thiazole monophosphate biosynthesis protein [Gammaproteobacteria bacterium SG8_11]
MASVLIPLAQGCEELEAVTIIDLMRRAGIEVVTASLTDEPIKASRGTVLIADTTLDKALQREYDMMVLPGGLPGADHLNADARIQHTLQTMAKHNKYTAAICAAPKVLATAGLLEGKRATSFPGVLEQLNLPATQLESAAVVKDGNVITSRGPGTAMDFALELIALLAGESKRQEVEAALQRH